MSDTTFERSLIALSVLVLIWIVLGIVFLWWWSVAGVVIIGLIVEIVGGGALLYFWGKNYMARG